MATVTSDAKGVVRRSLNNSKTRSVVACNRCRTRKTRCAGNPPLPCAACLDAGATCLYSEAEKRRFITEKEYRELKSLSHAQAVSPALSQPLPRSLAKAKRHGQQETRLVRESSLNKSNFYRSPTAPPSVPSLSTGVSQGEDTIERDDWWYEETKNVLLNRSGERHFLGPSAATHMVERLNPGSTNLAWDVRPLYDDPSFLRRPMAPALPVLPTIEFAKRLFWVQYSYIGTIFSLIHPRQFEERLLFVYNQPTDFSRPENCLIYCQTLLVIAFGLMYSLNQWSGDDGPPGFKYFKHALQFLPDIHEQGSIFFVEVLCYVAYFMQNLNRRDAAFIYIGLALRMAISLGLHQEVSDPAISETDRNRRRNAWWSVYSLDRVLSVRSGNPITIQDDDIGISWPAALDGSICDPWPSVVLTYYTQVSRILGRIGEEIYRKKPRSGSNLVLSVQSIMSELTTWQESVPEPLRIDFNSSQPHANRETISINLHFYSCVNMTARPLVFYIIKRRLDTGIQRTAARDWKNDLAPNTIAVIESCVAAARATTTIMDAADKHGLIATYGYLDGDYIFAAALLLVMVNAAFPYNEANARSMDTALDLLRKMADKGNAYLGSRHSLLLELREAIDPSFGTNVIEEVSRSNLQVPSIPNSDQTSNPDGEHVNPETPLMPSDDWPHAPPFPWLENISSQTGLDTALWEGALDEIDIDMDTDLIESTLRR
ncbi:hypothetical protein POX_a01918 [Penicillium oxalicum]|uniref:hypothetical protein n=1 Tax=Penicillium oxalicum TaxID=69781 RepID=UPI0020B75733|nr:hypothetical protein POX_a01918 [Penicillium oxalicum]KAI2795312.1 hypothetical protein POX_a01918 [Penicillium oxalicum]